MTIPHRSFVSRLGWRRPEGRSRRWRWIAGLLALAFISDLIWIHLKFPVAARTRILPPAEATGPGPAAPVLVLGAGVYADGEPTEVLEARLRTALALHRAGRAPWFLVSGDNRALNYNEPMAMRRWLARQGVPDALIVADFAGRRTYDSLRRARDVFGAGRLYVVTSDFHLPRALYLARRLGLDAWGVPASTGDRPFGHRLVFHGREWLARHKAVLDAWYPPDVLLGPPEPTPDHPLLEGK